MQLIRIGVAVLCMSVVTAQLAQARNLTQIKASGVLRIGTPGDVPPFSMAQGANYSGFEVELIQQVATDLGVRAEFIPTRIDQITKGLQEDRIDVGISSLGITSTRENKVDFTIPTACAGVSIVSPDPTLKTHLNLEGHKIGVIAGSIFTSYIQKLPFDKQVNVYPTNNDVVLAVFSKQVDATLAWTASEGIVKKLYPKAALYFSASLFSVPIGMMVSETNNSTRFALNTSLNRMLRNGSHLALSMKYFGSDMRCK